MENLLDVIPAIIAGYLPPSDALNLGRTCRKLNAQLSLRVTIPREILTRFFRDDRNGEFHRGFPIPFPTQVPIHTAVVSMTWMDQGWGNRKSRVSVMAEEEGRAYDASEQWKTEGQFGGRRVVFSSGVANHREERLDIQLSPRKGESYRLWYSVGGGGGHSMTLKNVNVRALLFDDLSSCFARAHDFLARSNISPPWDAEVLRPGDGEAHAAILASARHLLAHDIPIPPPMIDFFNGRGVPAADISLELIQTAQSLWEEWNAESLAYREGYAESSASRRHGQPGPERFQQFAVNLGWLAQRGLQV